jgi:hypothetical protein
MRANEFVVEALTPEQTAKLFKDLGAKYDANIHDNVFKGKPRIYIPLPASTGAVIPQQSATQSEVQSAVQSVGYNIDDYQAGIASKTDDPNRKIRIGKLIKDQALLQQFANDKTRAAAKQQNLAVAISRDPVDIGGMSTDRGWTSCMDLRGGVNKKYVPTEIKNGAIIAYLINDDDRDINRPKARILLKPYYQDNHMILVPDQVYGTAPTTFPELVKKFATWANSGSPEGDYRLSKGSYEDDTEPDQYHITSYYDIENASLNKKTTIASNKNAPPEILAKLVLDKNVDVRWRLAQNKSTPPEALAKLARDKQVNVRWSVAQNTSTPPEALANLVRDENADVHYGVAKNTSTPPEALAKLVRDKNVDVRFSLAQNTSTPPEALAKLVRDKNVDVRWRLAQNKSTPPEALAKLVRDKDEDVCEAAAENTSMSPEVLADLAYDPDNGIRYKVTQNTSMPPEILAKLGLDPESDFYVRLYVANNTSTPPEVSAKLLMDPDIVRLLRDLNRTGDWEK